MVHWSPLGWNGHTICVLTGVGEGDGLGLGDGVERLACPMLFAFSSVNQRLPSGPVVIPRGSLLLVGIGYSVMVPLGVIFPILFVLYSVNQRLPSGPVVIPRGLL